MASFHEHFAVVKIEPREDTDNESVAGGTEYPSNLEESTVLFVQCLVCHKTITSKDTCCAGDAGLTSTSVFEPVSVGKTPSSIQTTMQKAFKKKPGRKAIIGPGPFTCLFCNKTCRLRQQLDTHLRTHIQEKPHMCKDCPWTFCDSAALRRHEMAKHTGGLPARFGCKYCPKKFYHPGHLIVHERYHTGEKPYKCSHCPKRFTIHAHWILHIRSVHTGERPFTCSICQRGFCGKTGLKLHQRSHSELKYYHCPLPDCGAEFKYMGALKRHLMAAHTGERPYACNWCGRKFVDNSDLNRHVRLHNNDKRYCCVFCQRRFTQSGVLWVHLRVHVGEKPFQCPDCDRVFCSNTDMTKHRRSHSKIMPFECVFCGKLFKQKKSLENHLLGHTDEKPENCQLCGDSFRGRGMRKTHLKLVHGVIPGKC